MKFSENKTIRVAILDLYEGHANQGMRCIREIINHFGEMNHVGTNTIQKVLRV